MSSPPMASITALASAHDYIQFPPHMFNLWSVDPPSLLSHYQHTHTHSQKHNANSASVIGISTISGDSSTFSRSLWPLAF